MSRLLIGLVVPPLLLGSSVVLSAAPSPAASAVSNAFSETFDGAPGTPQPWRPATWDVTVHSRDTTTWDALEPMQAQHGADCGAPPATHTISSYDDAVFLCRDHVMTAINASGYGLIYLTPDREVDLSSGSAVIRFDMSTLRTSGRDWTDLWITPFEDNVQLPLEADLPDLSGPPRRAIHIKMDFGQNRFLGEVYRNYQADVVKLAGPEFLPYDTWLTPDAARRDTFELRITNGRIQFGMPAYNRWWVDDRLPALDWSRGVVQFGHHSYTPTKDCVAGPCQPNTWHWDNVTIDPAVPFSMLRADRRVASDARGTAVNLPAPAPAGSYLRFAGIGSNIQVSTDGGASWIPATMQRQGKPTPGEHFASYWTPIPAGATTLRFRGQPWWGGAWQVRHIGVWADNGVARPPSVASPPQGISTEITPVNPVRLLDTRPDAVTADGAYAATGAPGTGNVLQLPVTGRTGIPADAPAVVLNLTATQATGTGYLTAWPCGEAFPLASTLNYSPGRDVANATLTKVGAGGTVCIYTGAATTDIVADVTGYFPADPLLGRFAAPFTAARRQEATTPMLVCTLPRSGAST